MKAGLLALFAIAQAKELRILTVDVFPNDADRHSINNNYPSFILESGIEEVLRLRGKWRRHSAPEKEADDGVIHFELSDSKQELLTISCEQPAIDFTLLESMDSSDSSDSWLPVARTALRDSVSGLQHLAGSHWLNLELFATDSNEQSVGSEPKLWGFMRITSTACVNSLNESLSEYMSLVASGSLANDVWDSVMYARRVWDARAVEVSKGSKKGAAVPVEVDSEGLHLSLTRHSAKQWMDAIAERIAADDANVNATKLATDLPMCQSSLDFSASFWNTEFLSSMSDATIDCLFIRWKKNDVELENFEMPTNSILFSTETMQLISSNELLSDESMCVPIVTIADDNADSVISCEDASVTSGERWYLAAYEGIDAKKRRRRRCLTVMDAAQMRTECECNSFGHFWLTSESSQNLTANSRKSQTLSDAFLGKSHTLSFFSWPFLIASLLTLLIAAALYRFSPDFDDMPLVSKRMHLPTEYKYRFWILTREGRAYHLRSKQVAFSKKLAAVFEHFWRNDGLLLSLWRRDVGSNFWKEQRIAAIFLSVATSLLFAAICAAYFQQSLAQPINALLSCVLIGCFALLVSNTLRIFFSCQRDDGFDASDENSKLAVSEFERLKRAMYASPSASPRRVSPMRSPRKLLRSRFFAKDTTTNPAQASSGDWKLKCSTDVESYHKYMDASFQRRASLLRGDGSVMLFADTLANAGAMDLTKGLSGGYSLEEDLSAANSSVCTPLSSPRRKSLTEHFSALSPSLKRRLNGIHLQSIREKFSVAPLSKECSASKSDGSPLSEVSLVAVEYPTNEQSSDSSIARKGASGYHMVVTSVLSGPSVSESSSNYSSQTTGKVSSNSFGGGYDFESLSAEMDDAKQSALGCAHGGHRRKDTPYLLLTSTPSTALSACRSLEDDVLDSPSTGLPPLPSAASTDLLVVTPHIVRGGVSPLSAERSPLPNSAYLSPMLTSTRVHAAASGSRDSRDFSLTPSFSAAHSSLGRSERSMAPSPNLEAVRHQNEIQVIHIMEPVLAEAGDCDFEEDEESDDSHVDAGFMQHPTVPSLKAPPPLFPLGFARKKRQSWTGSFRQGGGEPMTESPMVGIIRDQSEDSEDGYCDSGKDTRQSLETESDCYSALSVGSPLRVERVLLSGDNNAYVRNSALAFVGEKSLLQVPSVLEILKQLNQRRDVINAHFRVPRKCATANTVLLLVASVFILIGGVLVASAFSNEMRVTLRKSAAELQQMGKAQGNWWDLCEVPVVDYRLELRQSALSQKDSEQFCDTENECDRKCHKVGGFCFDWKQSFSRTELVAMLVFAGGILCALILDALCILVRAMLYIALPFDASKSALISFFDDSAKSRKAHAFTRVATEGSVEDTAVIVESRDDADSHHSANCLLTDWKESSCAGALQ